jgi:transposase InsO family protein
MRLGNTIRPNESWVSDITYTWTNEGWLYLAGVKKLYTKELVGLPSTSA